MTHREELMRFTHLTNFTAVFLAVLTMNVCATAQAPATPREVGAEDPRYRLIDLGTFGGPASYFQNGFDGILNNHGASADWANTSTPDPFCSAALNCFATHAFRAQSGTVTDLGVLDGGSDSQAFWISGNGLIVGLSQNGEFDPFV